MTWLSNLFAGGAGPVFESASDLVQSIYTSPGVKLSKEEALQKAENIAIKRQQEVDIAQIKANGEKKDPTWKSAIAWVCVAGIFYQLVARPFFIVYVSYAFPEVDIGELITLISGLLGMSTLHLVDKLKNRK